MIVRIFVKFLCKIHGYQVKPIQDRAGVIEFYELRNRVFKRLYQVEPTPIPEPLELPKGQTRWFGIYHQSQLVGTTKLSDLAHETSVVEHIYSTMTFDYSPADTYEFTGLVIDREHQGKSRSLFYILMAITHWYTLDTGKKRWLVSAHKRLYQRLLHMGLTLEYISDNVNVKDDGTPLSEFLLNYYQNEKNKDCCCFYAYQPKNLAMMQLKKFIKYQFRRWYRKSKIM